MDDTVAPYQEEPTACPFVALEDDRDRRTDRPDYRHRCFASRQPEPRAFPHQERYCLSRGFTDCPIFLDWARREGATVIAPRRPQPAAQPADEEDVAAAEGVDAAEGEMPAFLAGRPRPPTRVDQAPADAPQPEEGLWGPADAGRRRAPAPVVGRARANVKHPEWEDAPHMESYPRIRHRRGLSGISIPAFFPIAIVVAGVALLTFLLLPGMLWPANSGAARPTATPTVQVTVRPTPTPVPTPTAHNYVVQSGDTLTSISTKFGVSIDDLRNANPDKIKGDTIFAGDQIVIPVPSVPTPEPTATNPQP